MILAKYIHFNPRTRVVTCDKCKDLKKIKETKTDREALDEINDFSLRRKTLHERSQSNG